MVWVEKHTPSPFDDQPIDGLWFLSGDLLARKPNYRWAHGEKCPMIAFPSGLAFPLWEKTEHEDILVYLGDDLALPLHSTRDDAYSRVVLLAEQSGYRVDSIGKQGLRFFTRNPSLSLYVIYDNETQQLVDVQALGTPPLD